MSTPNPSPSLRACRCVPQRVEPGPLQLPQPSAMVPDLPLERLSGRWYITHGLNEVFDCFPCQQHQVPPSPYHGEDGPCVIVPLTTPLPSHAPMLQVTTEQARAVTFDVTYEVRTALQALTCS